jgi:selenocysteine-specific elongation factor
MKSAIVGTAGHIDHGKTALVKALTGIDADRLEEEKRRGITIDIGFAHLDLPGPEEDPLRLGFVDVPGHERFVRNMLAGVGGIDIVLLVIAADESIKPQTREHFDICRLLSVRRGITALTKSDLVDRETLEVVRLEVEEYLRNSFLDVSRAPIVAVSSRTGAGIEDLRRALVEVAAEVPARDSTALARLPIDRVFTMKGFGTVVTGTLISGTVRKEDELEVFPNGQRVRVRAIEVHGKGADQAGAGQRTALNLGGVTREQLARGMMLASPGVFRPTSHLDVELSLLSSAKPLKERTRVRFHSYTSEIMAALTLHGEKQVAPGETAFAQLRLAHPTLLLPGDRFILRQLSPVMTIGGGAVVENTPSRKIGNRTEYISFLRQLRISSKEALRARVAAAGRAGLTMSDGIARTGWMRQQLASTLAGIPEITTVGEHLILTLALDGIEQQLSSTLDAFHNQNPLVAGMSKEELRGRFPDVSHEVFSRVLERAARDGKVELAGDLVRLRGRNVVMKDEESESKRILEAAFQTAGLKVPAMKEVLAGLKVDKARAQKIVTLLLRDKVLVKVSDDLLFHREALDDLRRLMAQEKTKSSKINVARFKDLTGVTRKYAIPLLEYLDRERITRRVGDERVIL